MLDLKLIRKDSASIEAKLKTKDPSVNLAPILSIDEKTRHLIQQTEELKNKRNHLSKQIGQKKQLKEDTTTLMQEVAGLGDQITKLDHELTHLETELTSLLAVLPNLPQDGIKISPNPKDNECIKTVGQIPQFNFPIKNHVELNEKLQLFDFKRGAKIAGSGWPVYKGMGARLEWALINYMLDVHLDNGFTQWMIPHLVRPEIMFGSGQLPKFEKQLFKLKDEDYDLFLIPTSEVALNGLHYDEILKEEELPLKYVSYSPCFRREAGAAGSQERGLIRVHQFNKVEMFCFATPTQSEEIFKQMQRSAELILEGLGLPYRSMLLVTGDMSFAASKTVDVEVWLPGQDYYKEVSSISNCGDFQSRRSQTRFRHKDEKPEFVHTLNGSGLATSRVMVALLENNQRADGSVAIPPILHKYLNGITELT